jgi:prenyltransferase beta subunit
MRMRAVAQRGAAFVLAAQTVDGGFPALPGSDSNAQSTGLALVALRVTGLDLPRNANGRTPTDYLSTLARPNGSIAYAARSNPTPVWTTAQALLGLTSRSKLLALGDPWIPSALIRTKYWLRRRPASRRSGARFLS